MTHGKRKFTVTMFIVVVSSAMVFVDKLEAAGWVTLATLCLSIYGAQNVIDKMKGGQG